MLAARPRYGRAWGVHGVSHCGRGAFVTFSALLLAALTLPPAAYAPPAIGVPNAVIAAQCVPYGQGFTMTGSGYAPRSKIEISAPLGHYTGPAPYSDIASVTTQAGSNGGFSETLRAPRVPKTASQYRWSYHPRVVFARGTGQGSGAAAESFDEVVIAAPAVCKALARSPHH